MSFAQAKELVRKKFEREKKGSDHDFTHILRVLKYAGTLAKKEKADIEIVRYAALFHDYVREPKHEVGGDHATLSAKAAAKILPRYVAKEKIPKILRAIRSHSRRSGVKPKTIEDKIIWDADKLDGFGSMGMARYLVLGDHLGWTIKKSAEYALAEVESYRKTAFFYTKLGKKLGNRRFQKCVKMCNDILEEAIE